LRARWSLEHGHCATAIRASIRASLGRLSQLKQLAPMLTNRWSASLTSAAPSRSRQGNGCPNGDRHWIRSRWSEQSRQSRSAVAPGQVGIVEITDRILRPSSMRAPRYSVVRLDGHLRARIEVGTGGAGRPAWPACRKRRMPSVQGQCSSKLTVATAVC